MPLCDPYQRVRLSVASIAGNIHSRLNAVTIHGFSPVNTPHSCITIALSGDQVHQSSPSGPAAAGVRGTGENEVCPNPKHDRWTPLPERSSSEKAEIQGVKSGGTSAKCSYEEVGHYSVSHPPDADALSDYNAVYNAPLSSALRRAIRALFTAEVPPPPVEALGIEP